LHLLNTYARIDPGLRAVWELKSAWKVKKCTLIKEGYDPPPVPVAQELNSLVFLNEFTLESQRLSFSSSFFRTSSL